MGKVPDVNFWGLGYPDVRVMKDVKRHPDLHMRPIVTIFLRASHGGGGRLPSALPRQGENTCCGNLKLASCPIP